MHAPLKMYCVRGRVSNPGYIVYSISMALAMYLTSLLQIQLCSAAVFCWLTLLLVVARPHCQTTKLKSLQKLVYSVSYSTIT